MRVEQVGEARAAAMVEQRDDRLDAPRAQELQAAAGPAQIDPGRIVGRAALPEHRRARRRHTEPGQQRDVGVAAVVAGARQLVDDARRVDPGDRRLGRSPELELGQSVTTGEGRVPSQLARSVLRSTCVPSRSSRRNSPNNPNASAKASCLWIDS